MKRRKGIKSLEEILKKFTNKPKLKKKLDGVEALDQLDTILGSNLRKYVSNKYFQNGIIYIHLTSSVLRSELSYQKEGMIESINKNIGRKVVKEIILK
ncbi:MAG: DUF721 domain-containing protein [Flavobacteriales bacterium]|nr:DUF721 domain-containing protein [Flavobacteriales bacterium]MBT6013530.1 DUF721 domain-containing protein [Flavobacteriales bacterium]